MDFGSMSDDELMTMYQKLSGGGGNAARPAGMIGGGRMSPQDSKRLSDTANAATNIRSARENAYEFVKRNEATPTGGYLALPKVAGMVGAVNGDVGALNGLSKAMIPQMHTTTGPMTDADAVMYEKAIPSVIHPYEANRALARNISRQEQEVAARATFLDTWAKKTGSLRGADVAFNRFWSDYQGHRATAPDAAPSQSGGVKYLGTE